MQPLLFPYHQKWRLHSTKSSYPFSFLVTHTDIIPWSDEYSNPPWQSQGGTCSAFPFHYCITSGILTLFSDRRMRQRSCHTPHLRDLTSLYPMSQQLFSRVPSLVNPRLGTTCHELSVPCAAWFLSLSRFLCSSPHSFAALLSQPHGNIL